MASVDDVAAAVLEQTGTITTKKLQKLVYYTQAWHLVFTGRPMFKERIEAWDQGPVVPYLYAKHRRRYDVSDWDGQTQRLTGVEFQTVDWVLRKYAHFTAEALSQMTHMEGPWRVARGLAKAGEKTNTPIDSRQMIAYYGRQRPDPDVAVAQVAASSAMEGQKLDDAWQEKLRGVAAGDISADDVVAEQIAEAQVASRR